MKKYYRLRKDLPTFDKGELFYMDSCGNLRRVKDHLMAYSYITIAKFPNILEEWFRKLETKEPCIVDQKIRRFVRDWATFNKIEEAFVEGQFGNDAWYVIHGNDEEKCRWKIEIHASYSKTINKNYDGTLIDIIELCGEEEDDEVQS